MGIRRVFIIAAALAVLAVLFVSPASALVEGPGSHYSHAGQSLPEAMKLSGAAIYPGKYSGVVFFRE